MGRHNGTKKIILWVFAGVIFITILFAISGKFGFLGTFRIEKEKRLHALWNAANYGQIIEQTDQLLFRSPMDSNALVYSGLAHFYIGIDQPTEEARTHYFDRSIAMLRKTLIHHQPPLEAEVHYVLAKVYYHKGGFNYVASADYMERAIEKGYIGEDSYEYLALAYAQSKAYEQSVVWFNRAVEHNPSDELSLALAETYREIGEFELADRHVGTVIDSSDNEILVRSALFTRGLIYIKQQNWHRAQEIFTKLIEEDPLFAEAHYQLGRIHLLTDNRERARYEWRETIRIDPGHAEALRSLQEY